MSDDVIARPPTFVLGLDLGQAHDWTALCVDRLATRPDDLLEHQIAGLERWRGERYPWIVRTVAERVQALRGPEPAIDQMLARHYPARYFDHRPNVVLVIDYTGPGRPVVDMFDEAQLDCRIVPVSITSGIDVTRSEDGHDYRVPKRILASTLHVLMQTDRIKVARPLGLRDVLLKEARNFRVRINKLGNDSYGAGEDWRDEDGSHDDLVLAVALAGWAGETLIDNFRWDTVGGEPLADWFRRAGISAIH